MGLIAHFFHIAFSRVEDLAITEYRILLEQAMNIANLYRQGQFEFLDSFEKQEEFENEIAFFRQKGKL